MKILQEVKNFKTPTNTTHRDAMDQAKVTFCPAHPLLHGLLNEHYNDLSSFIHYSRSFYGAMFYTYLWRYSI